MDALECADAVTSVTVASPSSRSKGPASTLAICSRPYGTTVRFLYQRPLVMHRS